MSELVFFHERHDGARSSRSLQTSRRLKPIFQSLLVALLSASGVGSRRSTRIQVFKLRSSFWSAWLLLEGQASPHRSGLTSQLVLPLIPPRLGLLRRFVHGSMAVKTLLSTAVLPSGQRPMLSRIGIRVRVSKGISLARRMKR